jgi:hypothetical protein
MELLHCPAGTVLAVIVTFHRWFFAANKIHDFHTSSLRNTDRAALNFDRETLQRSLGEENSKISVG